MKSKTVISLTLALVASFPAFSQDNPEIVNGYGYVDLGLSVKWATCDVGAVKDEATGDCYVWGKAAGGNASSFYVFNFSNFHYADSEYIDGASGQAASVSSYDAGSVLAPNDDAANISCGYPWRTPTAQEWEELISGCEWTWTEIGGVQGCKGQSKIAGYTDRWIFLPGIPIEDGELNKKGWIRGSYWTSSCDASGSQNVLAVEFTPKLVRIAAETLGRGHKIRPVADASMLFGGSSVDTPNGSHSAKINTIRIENDVKSDEESGLNLHLNLSVEGMKGKDAYAAVNVYDAPQDSLKSGRKPLAAALTEFKPGYDKSNYEDLKVFLPYYELRQRGSQPRKLYLDLLVWDRSGSESKVLTRRNNIVFNYTPKQDSYLKVDGNDSGSTSFPASGGTKTYTVLTDADAWFVSDVPSFCEITDKTADSFTLRCKSNPDSERSGSLTVKTATQDITVNISQNTVPSAKINSIRTDYNVYWTGKKGIMIHIDFEVKGLKGHNINPIAYFEYQDGGRLVDINDYFCSEDGQVCTSAKSYATYEDTHWGDFQLFMPYDELHVRRNRTAHLQFQVQIHDQTSGNTLVTSENYKFSYSNY